MHRQFACLLLTALFATGASCGEVKSEQMVTTEPTVDPTVERQEVPEPTVVEPEPEPNPEPPEAPAVAVPTAVELRPFAVQPTLDESVLENLAAITTQAARREDVFAKVGGSSTESRAFMTCFATPHAVLADHEALAPTIAFFRSGNAARRSPFWRESAAAAVGWSTRHVLHGTPPRVVQEINQIRPRYAFLFFGANDVEGRDPARFAQRLNRIITLTSERGVIPILGTIPSRLDDREGDKWVTRYNLVAHALARHRRVPIVDLHAALRPLRNRGLAGDGLHPNVYLDRGRGRACDFTEEGLTHGHNARNLAAMTVLHSVRTALVDAGAVPPAPPPAAEPSDGPSPEDPQGPTGEETEPSAPEATPLPAPVTSQPGDVIEVSHAPFTHVFESRGGTRTEYEGVEGTFAGGDRAFSLHLDEGQSVRITAVQTRRFAQSVCVRQDGAGPYSCRRVEPRERLELSPGSWEIVVDSERVPEEPALTVVAIEVAERP